MQASESLVTKPRSWWVSTAGILLIAGFLSSLAAWWLIAIPVLTVSNVDRHAGHFVYTYVHALSGTLMLFLGLVNIYIGTTYRFFEYHRLVGATYLLGGAFGAISAIVITLGPNHKPVGAGVFTNSTVSLVCLATAWLGSAAMAYRAARNGRYDTHRDWIIRSYVLVWSFVFCRLASRVPGVGDLGGGEAFIWLSWVGPILVCEFFIQWRNGAKRKPAASA